MSKCKECKWWSGNRKTDECLTYGDCRLKSPHVVQMGEISTGLEHDTVWPRTDAWDWCGEWEHISEPVSRMLENSSKAYERAHGGENE